MIFQIPFYLSDYKHVWTIESLDFSQAEKEITTFKAEQIHKMTTVFTPNGPR